jgi:cytochrome c556
MRKAPLEKRFPPTLLCALLVAYSTTAQPAAQPSARPAAQSEAAPSDEQIVRARRAAMYMAAAVLGCMEGAADRGAKADTQKFEAGGLDLWARALPAMFTPGTGSDVQRLKSHARPEIWTQRAAFDKSAGELTAGTSKLKDLASGCDTAGFKSQIRVVVALCESCHEDFRTK